MADIFNPVNLHVFTEHLSSLSQALYLIGKLDMFVKGQNLMKECVQKLVIVACRVSVLVLQLIV